MQEFEWQNVWRGAAFYTGLVQKHASVQNVLPAPPPPPNISYQDNLFVPNVRLLTCMESVTAVNFSVKEEVFWNTYLKRGQVKLLKI
jgi:hypothetical protein